MEYRPYHLRNAIPTLLSKDAEDLQLLVRIESSNQERIIKNIDRRIINLSLEFEWP